MYASKKNWSVRSIYMSVIKDWNLHELYATALLSLNRSIDKEEYALYLEGGGPRIDSMRW